MFHGFSNRMESVFIHLFTKNNKDVSLGFYRGGRAAASVKKSRGYKYQNRIFVKTKMKTRKVRR